ncbi:hypothetical protein B0H13DRAFT_1175947 [Mycena leptocephala]|nr:hypothetical protein B0H13DRAFT_1175947 [Mycena leptocephala]
MSAQNPALTILSLPDELLEAIAAAGQEGRVPDLQMTFKSEWTLSHLCRRFRGAIIGAPTLWTLVEANLDKGGSVEIFKLYLERSRACNIWANLHWQWAFDLDLKAASELEEPYLYSLGPELIQPEYGLIAERLGHIIPHVNRIWRLRIMLKTRSAGRLLTSFRDLAAPNLQHLDIANSTKDKYSCPSAALEMFSLGAPRLTFLRMAGFNPSPAPASITCLELWRAAIDEDDYSFFAAIATQCRSLVRLRLDVRSISPEAAQCRFRIPSLKFLRISISYGESQSYLLGIVELFDTPGLTEFIIDNTHGNQIVALFNLKTLLHTSFPALTSLSFANNDPCSCDGLFSFSDTISSPPLEIFPVLSSLTLINQCFTSNLVTDILGPASQPWPLLKTVTLCSREDTLEVVSNALRIAVNFKRKRGHTLPKFRLSPALSSLEDWRSGKGADVEIFDPGEILKSFESSTWCLYPQ